MKINPIGFNYGVNSQNIKNKVQKNNIEQNKIENLPPVSASYMLAFTGGKSLNLEQTVKQIEQFGSFPPDIKEEAEQIIKEGNPDNKTLIDVHKEKYEGLNYLDNLDDIKELYPEFEGVLPDSAVEIREGSFMDDVKKGKIPYFDKNQDVAVQLLQMYWGEGFSLNDLKTQFAGKNINSVFEKLNIPKTDRTYGYYLKFSDKEYNERFTSKMSERLKGRHREKIARKDGVYIPRGPLTPEHKANISKGLIKHYTEHPEKALEMSERQKRFYEEHPEEKIKFSEVMLRAWGKREATPIKKALSRFLKRPLTDEELSNIFAQNKETKAKMQAFWDKNKWAKDKFSNLMKKSWARQKELDEMGLIYEPFYTANLIPKKMQEKIGRIMVPNNKNFANIPTSLIPDLRELTDNPNLITPAGSIEMKETGKIIDDYFDANPSEQDVLADTLDMGFAIAIKELAEEKVKNMDKYPAFAEMTVYWQDTAVQKWKQHTPTGIDELTKIYSTLMNICVANNDLASAKKIDKSIESAYDLVINKNPKIKDMTMFNVISTLIQMGLVEREVLFK